MIWISIYMQKQTIKMSDVSATSWRHCQGKLNIQDIGQDIGQDIVYWTRYCIPSVTSSTKAS